MPNASSTRGDRPGSGGNEAACWNARVRDANPFVDHRFLGALAEAGCIGPGTGWTDLCDRLSTPPERFVPAWGKQHSHGEFVFDFHWAQAAHRAGLRWYPKLLVAAPLTPVTGARLLADDENARAAVVDDLTAFVDGHGLSSCGVNFCDISDATALREAGWLERGGWQFHWHNRGWADFDQFLEALRSKPRKNIRRERRLAQADGWRYRWVDGAQIDGPELDLVADCYQATFLAYGNLPSLNRDFFARAARAFGPQFLVCIASRHGRDLACSVFWRNDSHLYGRYWGALTETRDVHFEACYYQGIDYCIEHGLEVFEPGAQGEHKIRRGFVPVPTRSFHYIAHPALRDAIDRWLKLEAQALAEYREQLDALIPYRQTE